MGQSLRLAASLQGSHGEGFQLTGISIRPELPMLLRLISA